MFAPTLGQTGLATIETINQTRTITDEEFRNANTQSSSIATHVPLAKIHKLEWLVTEEHGDGTVLELKHGEVLQFRFISPFSRAPTAGLAKLLNEILKPLQNSGLRIESSQEIAKDIQTSWRKKTLRADETWVSFDAQKMYDCLSIDLIKQCVKSRFHLIERNLNYSDVIKAMELCYTEGLYFRGSIYMTKNGGPTGHAITSTIQNIVMSAVELEIFQPEIIKNNLSSFYRWVDDILVRIKKDHTSTILDKLNTFDKTDRLKFTIEEATEENGQHSLPFLDINLKWSKDTWETTVYRKKLPAKL